MDQGVRDKTRGSYFTNVKTRLGSKLSASPQPPGLMEGPCSPQYSESHGGYAMAQPWGTRPHQVPRIRNPRLRQYYLKDATSLPEISGGNSACMDSSEVKAGDMVRPDDTVFSVASQFSTTPTQVPHLNRPPSHTLVPEQCLGVLNAKDSSSRATTACSNRDSTLAPVPVPSGSLLSPSPDAEYDKLLDVEAVPMPDGQLCLLALPPECSEGEGPTSMPYLKLCCRYITDRKGVVSGILLVTPNKIFFDPYKSHPLVVENGCEEYLFSHPVDGLLSVSFCTDISNVHFSTSTQRMKDKRRDPNPKALRNLARKFRREKHGAPANQKAETVLALVTSATPDLRSNLGVNRMAPLDDQASGLDSMESQDMAETERRLGLTGVGCGSPVEDGPAVQSAGVLGAAVPSSTSSSFCGELHKGDKVAVETVCGKEPAGSSRQAACSHGALMFVKLRLKHSQKKMKKSMFSPDVGKATTALAKEAWFTLSQESSDELYAYLSHWRPDLCILDGREDEEEGEEGFVLVDDQEEEEEVSRNEWEMVSVEDSGVGMQALDKEPEGLAEILNQSHILEAKDIREISSNLPPRTVGHSWKLSYSTSRHGASLRSLYRRLSATDSPTLIIIKDSQNQVFGGFLSHPLRPSESFYGTGETFLFTLHPSFECFRWTGANSYFIKGDLDSFAIGGGSGHFGLWVDESLYYGRRGPCQTFNNRCLSETDDFRVLEMEVWTFC